ncbi:unnamed protein product [Malus baccata var. baccata]
MLRFKDHSPEKSSPEHLASSLARETFDLVLVLIEVVVWGARGGGGVGVVLLDEASQFVAAMAMRLNDISSSLQEELEVARVGVLGIQGDATTIHVTLNSHDAGDTSLMGNLVNNTRHFLRSIPQTKLIRTRREANRVAHRLVLLGLNLDQRRVWFEEPPDAILDLIMKDSLSL